MINKILMHDLIFFKTETSEIYLRREQIQQLVKEENEDWGALTYRACGKYNTIKVLLIPDAYE